MSSRPINTISVGVNGLGRFGLHLVRYWIVNNSHAHFSIDYINDSFLDIGQVAAILEADKYIKLKEFISIDGSELVVKLPKRPNHRISFTNNDAHNIPWIESVDLILECSGKNTNGISARKLLGKNSKHVLISATAEKPDHICIYGFNHEEHQSSHKVISYGSCTLNAYIPLAAAIDRLFGIKESDVHIIHNVPEHKLVDFNSLERRTCTLEYVAPQLLSFLNDENFKVAYTLVPYSGVSIIDFRFRLKTKPDQHLLDKFIRSIDSEELKDLFGLSNTDKGPEAHKFTPYSAVIVKSSIKLVGQNLYFQAYFDNENSANRYFDTANHIAARMQHV